MHFDRTDLIEPIYFRDSLSQYFTFPPVNTCTVEYGGINFDVPIISFRVNAGNASIDPRST